MSDVVRLMDVREDPLSVDEVLAAVREEGAGGLCVFVGVVRDQDRGREVRELGYSAHPTVIGALRRVATSVAEENDVLALAAVHRVGELAVGDLAVVAAAAARHRGAAFDACRALIDRLKQTAPIWKHQQFADGTDEWVGSP